VEIRRMVSVVDTHTGGEPTRIVIGGAPSIPGATMAEKWLAFRRDQDGLRRFLVQEPRGHGDIFGALLVPPCRPEAQVGVLFMDSGGSLSMCGHGSIGLARTLVDLGMVERRSPVTEIVLDTPPGLVRMEVEVDAEGRPGDVSLRNVPAFVAAREVEIDLPGEGAVRMDVCFGGNFFAILDATRFDLALTPSEAPRLVRLGLAIREEVNRVCPVRHPLEPDIDRIELVEFSLERPGRPTRNAVVFAEGSIDRSPCGTGTCAKMALLAAKGKLAPGERFVHESITGSLFTGSYEPGPRVGDYETVLPVLRSRSYITGFNTLLEQAGDELAGGFLLGR